MSALRSTWLHFGVVLTLLAQLLAMAHLLVVQHSICEDHGELVEADGHAAHDPSNAPPDASDDDDDDDATHSDGDTHCRANARVACAVPMPAWLPPSLLLVAHELPRRQPVSLPHRASVLRVAPKTSPPVRFS